MYDRIRIRPAGPGGCARARKQRQLSRAPRVLRGPQLLRTRAKWARIPTASRRSFCKPSDAVSYVPDGVQGEFPYPPGTSNCHFEIELVVAIGKGGKDIAVEDAAAHVFGYAVGWT